MRLLFVCYGNTCRSPMAEGLAKKVLPDKIHVESAGLAPLFDGAAPEAVRVMKHFYDVDISGHKARNIAGLLLKDFDLIIVLDTAVHDAIKRLNPSLSAKMALWPIEDPFGKETDDYKKTAEHITQKIRECLVPLLTKD